MLSDINAKRQPAFEKRHQHCNARMYFLLVSTSVEYSGALLFRIVGFALNDLHAILL